MFLAASSLVLSSFAAPAAEFRLSLPDFVSPSSGCTSLASHDGVSPRSGVHFPFDNYAGNGTTGAKFTATDGNGPKVFLPYVDGVFTLDGNSKISSTGLTFAFPATNGAFNDDAIRDGIAALDGNDTTWFIELGDQPSVLRGGIGIPGNSGLTIDLDRIEAGFPGAQVIRIEGTMGISVGGTSGTLSFHVLADGAPIVQQQLTGAGAFHPLAHAVPANARFLTIAVADLAGTATFDGAAIADARLVLGGDFADCNQNGVPDPCDLELGTSEDCDSNTRPDDCEWVAVEYGSGFPGGGGFTPRAMVFGCVTQNGVLYYHVSDGLGGAPAFVIVGTSPTDLATAQGPHVLVGGPAPTAVAVKFGGVGFGKGNYTVFGTQPYGLLSYTAAYVQTFVLDPYASGGIAATRGMKLETFAVD
jgi:hypothetical protein